MIFPPLILRIRIIENGRKKIGLWLPLFLVWPIMLLFAIILAPMILLLALIPWSSGKVRIVLFGLPVFFYLFCHMRGLKLDIRSRNENVFVNFQ